MTAAPGPSPPSPPTAPPAPPRDRLEVFDAARFLAAVAIVWLHTPQAAVFQPRGAMSGPHAANAFTRFAVPFFALGAVYFVFAGERSRPGRPFGPFFRSRFERIYVPFLAWSVIYFVFRNFKHRVLHADEAVPFTPGMLLIGTQHHLWFLPFVFGATLIAFAAARVAGRVPVLALPMMVGAAAAGALIAAIPNPAWIVGDDPLRYMGYHLWEVAGAVLWGVALGIGLPRLPDRAYRNTPVAVAGLAAAAASGVGVYLVGRNNLYEALGGLGFFAFALAPWRGKIIGAMAPLGRLAYGIYLSHILFLLGAQTALQRWAHGAYWWIDVASFLLALVASTLLTMGLNRSRWGSRLVP